MTEKGKKPKRSNVAETIIDSDEGKLTFLKREMLRWRDAGFFDDPHYLISEPLEGTEPLIDTFGEALNRIERINDAQSAHSFLNNTRKPHGGYYKVKRGHRWQTKSYEGAIEFHEELSASQFEIYCKIYARAKELKATDSDPAQLNAHPTSYSRFYADFIYRKHGLPTGSKRYAIRRGASTDDPASWIGDCSDEWLALGLPDLKRKVVNAFYTAVEPLTPDGLDIYEAYQLPPFFGFQVDSDVGAAADIHEAALGVERLEGLLPNGSFSSLVNGAMVLQSKLTTLGDMIAKADPTNPDSLTTSEAVEAGLEREIGIANWRKKGNDKNKEKTKPYRDMAKAILRREKDRNLTRNRCAGMVIREYNLEVDQSAVAKAIKELFQERSNSKESRPKDEWLK